MQFYRDGYYPGDPRVHAAAQTTVGDAIDGGEVDVLIIGTGPAGLVLAAQLAAFADIRTMIVERRDGPLALGQADGIACRSMEMFEAFGIAERIKEEAYWVNEVVFWRPDPQDRSRISRSGRIQDVEDGLSEMPHVILNQARVHGFLLDFMKNSPSRLEPHYGVEITALDDSGDGPVRVTLRRTATDEEVHVSARYVVGADGARSVTRGLIGSRLEGEAANVAWGVMDVLATTDFPDIRFKALIQSESHGNVLIIPREGGNLFRMYVELDKLGEGERVRDRGITSDYLIEAAQRVLHPYALDVKEIAWWSVYEIGQRIASAFDNTGETGIPSVFLMGDACHTHSPKAGQGMNVSMGDGFNLGWKLAAVLRGQADESLLRTYSEERRLTAQALVDFDKKWAAMMSAKVAAGADDEGVSPEQLQRQFSEQGRYTAGFATTYAGFTLTGEPTHQDLASGLPLGERFQSAEVVRVADAKRIHLGHVARADGRWRLYLFADPADPRSADSRLAQACAELSSDVLPRFTPAGADIDAVIDVLGVVQQGHRDLDITDLPELLRPTTGRYGLLDYEKAYSAEVPGADIYAERGIDRERGCLVLVRPDQYVAHILPLDATDELAEFLGTVLKPQSA